MIFYRNVFKRDIIESTVETLHIEIDTQTSTPLRKELYGFNSNMMTGDYGYLDGDFVALTKALRPKTLRFPGGTVGNFYHWNISGFKQEEMNSTLSTQLNRRNRGNYTKLQKRRDGIISFDDYMKLCQDLNITPVIVVNMWTGNPEQSAAWVRYTMEKGYKVDYWELGNEYYLPHYVKKFRTANIYMNEAKKHALAMKAVNPEIKVSVCVSPVAFHKEGFLIKTVQRKWDEKLASYSDPSTTEWYDAFTVHVYAYKAVKDVEIDTMRRYLFGWIHFGFDIAMEYYHGLFPDKEMWVTEWNIANPANRVANTQLHAMYVGDFLIRLLSYPNIKHANFHVITGPGKGFPVFSRITPINTKTFWKYGGEPKSDYGDTIRRTVYSSFQLIGEAFAESDTQYAISMGNIPQLAGKLDYENKNIPGVQIQAIGSSQTVFLTVSNRTADDLVPNFKIDGRDMNKDVVYRFVANDNLSASNGGNAEMEGSGKIEVKIQEWRGHVNIL
ncbi:hypothetical protein JT359_20530 [Candidatus Poribacteria bacterium]|nr:hypothetical protein [Candidatus Poribacteria bacterium]